MAPSVMALPLESSRCRLTTGRPDCAAPVRAVVTADQSPQPAALLARTRSLYSVSAASGQISTLVSVVHLVWNVRPSSSAGQYCTS